jgi:APA family basic amino acid/polyamine antiporter
MESSKTMSGKESGSQFFKQLTLADTAFLVVGAVIGSGIFLTPGLIAAGLPSPGLLLVVWLAGGLIALCGALSFAELGAMYPQAGGQYVYLREAYGRGAAFLFGWGFFGFIMCGGLAALAVGFAEFFGSFVPALAMGTRIMHFSAFGLSYTLSAGQVVAAAAIFLLTLLNSFGIRAGVAVQNLLTVFRIGAVLAIVVLGALFGVKKGVTNFHPLFQGMPAFPGFLRPLGLALVAVFWTYDGWYSVNCTAEEIRDPENNIPRGLALGVAGVTILYVSVNVIYLLALPLEKLKGVTRVGELVTTSLFGGGVSTAISAVIMISVFGCLNANLLFGPRVYYAMAKDGSFFRSMARLSLRWRVPARALWGQAAWSAVLCLTGTYQALYEYMVFALLVFFAATGLAVIVLRHRRPGVGRPYKTWGYPFVPAVFFVVCLAIFLSILLAQPLKSAAGLVLLGAGLPAYSLWSRRRSGERANSNKRVGTGKDLI